MRRTRRVILAAVFALLGATAMLLAASDASSARGVHIDVKGTVRRQPQLLDATLSSVHSAPADHAQLYFVGFAGYGAQSVFKREVVAVRRLFDEKFGTRGRSVALINHWSTLSSVPLATVSNLDRVLHHVGGLMNPERDTLFLFLTSHGEENLLEVQMPGFRLRNLTPQLLKAMLDDSGIKNRVIVVSACHSGSFISDLADATTLVITAARADRTSFGCEDRRRWTYFGDAYFNRSLRHDSSFTRAFQSARRLINLWEMRDRLLPSLPQSAGGEALALGN
ncbi:MAG TPA: C13 family peptidase [Hyphomicrobiaceae bacterium]|jgi:hypothetical protein|nr:C13 family peptidase [Hyphomicrobiaceae bacterium]